MRKMIRSMISLCLTAVIILSGTIAVSAEEDPNPKYNDYMQQILDDLGDNDEIPINVIAFLRVSSDEIKAVQKDFAARFIAEADRAAYSERLDAGSTMRYEYEHTSEEMLNYLNSRDEEFYEKAVRTLGINEEDIVFTGKIDWFNDVTKWNADNTGSVCIKNLTKSKFLELNDSDLVSEFFKETEGSAEDFGAGTKENNVSEETYTYYFLAPADWCMKEYGAANEDIGCYWWNPEEKAEWPGVRMTAAPEIGRNVYKIDDVPKQTSSIVFNDYNAPAADYKYQTVIINTEGWAKGECPYDAELSADSFDGWIFVFDCDSAGEDWEHSDARLGTWFTIDDYRKHDDYYGTYSELKETDDIPVISGDIDGDGTATSNDALDILRMSTGSNTVSGHVIRIADIDGDGEVTSGDALAVLRYSVGIDG